jgi:hypothetical protein
MTGFSHLNMRRRLSASPLKLTRYKMGSRKVINRAELLELMKPKKAEGPGAGREVSQTGKVKDETHDIQ